MKSEYLCDDVTSDDYIKRSRVRFNSTFKNVDMVKHPVLDIGEQNALGMRLKADAWTDWDLNQRWPDGKKYSTIFCFEVLEHLERPDVMLAEIRNHLNEGGLLYLTTPVRWWMGKGERHFKEYSRDDLVRLLSEATFSDISITRIRAYDLMHLGVRPLIRWIRDLMFGQCFFVLARA
jgi:SAM-dependent methyltransferase